jgi:hypothetical protein
MARVSERKRQELMKDFKRNFELAGNERDTHRQYCKICKNEPAENFHDPDPWGKKPSP